MVVELVAGLVPELDHQPGLEVVEMVPELVAHLVLELLAEQGPETLEVVIELVAHLVLELAPQALDFSPDILEVRLQDGSGCSA
jgi:hypothetical protein